MTENHNNKNCEWLQQEIMQLPLIKFPFKLDNLPDSGIYFFYEKEECWGHGGHKPRVVRIGSCKNGNFQSRISEHYLLDERKMEFNSNQAGPKERSIFRKNIGRALLNKHESNYLKIWEIDFTDRDTRKRYGHLRDISLEQKLERQITKIMRETFTFRFIKIENEMGGAGLESKLIGTIAHCELCKPSKKWLGQFSPKEEIRKSGLWLIQHLASKGITQEDRFKLKTIINSGSTQTHMKNNRL